MRNASRNTGAPAPAKEQGRRSFARTRLEPPAPRRRVSIRNPNALQRSHHQRPAIPMTRNNMLYLLVGALAVVAAILAWNLYQAKKQPEGMQINVGPGGISIEKK
jgi:hypothetical protein